MKTQKFQKETKIPNWNQNKNYKNKKETKKLQNKTNKTHKKNKKQQKKNEIHKKKQETSKMTLKWYTLVCEIVRDKMLLN